MGGGFTGRGGGCFCRGGCTQDSLQGEGLRGKVRGSPCSPIWPKQVRSPLTGLGFPSPVPLCPCPPPFPRAQKPDQAGLQKLVPPLGEALGKANQLTEGKRRSTFNHAKAVAESLSCLTWILYTEKGCGEISGSESLHSSGVLGCSFRRWTPT